MNLGERFSSAPARHGIGSSAATRWVEALRSWVLRSRLMTETELSAYQSKMRSLKTSKEKEAYSLEHHALMQQRATEKGITLPGTPTGPGPASQGNSAGGGAKGKGPAGK